MCVGAALYPGDQAVTHRAAFRQAASAEMIVRSPTSSYGSVVASSAPVFDLAAGTRPLTCPAVHRPTAEGGEEVEGPAHLEELPAQNAAVSGRGGRACRRGTDRWLCTTLGGVTPPGGKWRTTRERRASEAPRGAANRALRRPGRRLAWISKRSASMTSRLSGDSPARPAPFRDSATPAPASGRAAAGCGRAAQHRLHDSSHPESRDSRDLGRGHVSLIRGIRWKQKPMVATLAQEASSRIADVVEYCQLPHGFLHAFVTACTELFQTYS